MTSKKAFTILAQATEPANATKINRSGYVQIEQALAVIGKELGFIEDMQSADDQPQLEEVENG